VLHHFDFDAALTKIRTAGNFHPQVDASRNSRRRSKVAPHERDPGASRSGTEFQPDVSAAPIAETGDHSASGNRLLQAGRNHALSGLRGGRRFPQEIA
jgi:hypothetical protein